MKKIKLLFTVCLGVGVLLIIVALICRYSTNSDLSGTTDQQVANILKSNDCLACHSFTAEDPFYAIGPAKEMVQKDIKSGQRFIDLIPVVENLEAGKAVAEIDLIKINQSIINKSMPLAKYTMLHWSSHLNGKEIEVLNQWVDENRKTIYPNHSAATQFVNEPIKPIRESIPVNATKAELGFDLFHDTRLSANNTISCATCHGLTIGGVDGLKTSKGIHDQIGGINAPTVYNAALNMAQFWDGRSKDLQAQAGGPPLDMLEMGSNWEEITSKLKEDKTMMKRFLELYVAEGITENSITDAIAEFEKTLLTPNAKFDKYLKGDLAAITPEEIEGYELFKSNNCASCHGGENMGGISYDYIGVAQDYFADRGTELHAKDMGRIGVTSLEVDKHKFKTPSLRNIALTAPYFHDGTINTLPEAVKLMHKYQMGKEMNEETVNKITLFLETLTGENQYMTKK